MITSEIIIDGYNLIHRAEDLRRYLSTGLEAAREQLLFRLLAFRQGKKITITVVFDGEQVGQPSKMSRSGIQIHYSIPPRKADEVIKILIRKSKNPANVTVISSDNEILGYALSSRAHGMKSEVFYRNYLLIEDKFDQNEESNNMSETELQLWLKLFRDGKED